MGGEVVAQTVPGVAAIVREVEVAGGGAKGKAFAADVEGVAENDVVAMLLGEAIS